MPTNVLTNSSQTATEIRLVKLSDWDSFCGQQDDFSQAYLRSLVVNNSEAKKAGLLARIPQANGELAYWLLLLDEDPDLWAAAGAATQLPAGVYRFVSDLDTDKLQAVSLGFALATYQFNRYKKAQTEKARLLLDPAIDSHALVTQLQGLCLTRDLINTPAQDMMPQHLAAAMRALAEEFSGQFSEVVGEDLLKEKFPVIHAVGRASVHAPRLLDLRWGQPNAPKLTLVGKGVCFDSGGLDLKPSNGMRLMKKDMGGAAHVIGLARMIMQAELPVRLRVLVPAVENAVSGDAFRPGDVLTARDGQTIEIDNTDAEGRLVLSDALVEASKESPDLLIDMATLTGAARVALGPDVPAAYATVDGTVDGLLTQAAQQNDPLWRMPLHQAYKRWLKSDIADMSNCAPGPFGGSITAALFLQSFINSEQDWLHFDVMAWNTENQPGRPRGGEAMGLRALFAYLAGRYC